MDSDDEYFDHEFNHSQEMDDEAEIGAKKNSSFKSLTATDIADLLDQYIDDIKDITKVSSTQLCWNVFSIFNGPDSQIVQHWRFGFFVTTTTTTNVIQLFEQLPPTTIRILLSHTKWDTDELLSKLTENAENRADFFARANVTDPMTKKPAVRKSSRKRIECSICFTECIQKV